MSSVMMEINSEYLDRLKSAQTVLGLISLVDAANLMLTIGLESVEQAVETGGQIAIVIEKDERWIPIQQPSLDNIIAIKNNETGGR